MGSVTAALVGSRQRAPASDCLPSRSRGWAVTVSLMPRKQKLPLRLGWGRSLLPSGSGGEQLLPIWYQGTAREGGKRLSALARGIGHHYRSDEAQSLLPQRVGRQSWQTERQSGCLV
jgi:hypothetical protein